MKLLVAAALALLSAPAVAQIQSVPVTFARGATSATLNGQLKGDATRDYVVNARAGQTLTVTLANPDGRAFFNVLPPGSGGEATFIGSTSGNSFSGPISASGNTVVRVYQMRATARRGEVANYTLTIGVTGPVAAGRRPGDAMVPGTAYNATATIRCQAGPGQSLGNCSAGVKRMANGAATVDVTTPDGGKRTINFVNGQARTSNAAYEMYLIPDAFVVGG
jgi:hypothetical protein